MRHRKCFKPVFLVSEVSGPRCSATGKGLELSLLVLSENLDHVLWLCLRDKLFGEPTALSRVMNCAPNLVFSYKIHTRGKSGKINRKDLPRTLGEINRKMGNSGLQKQVTRIPYQIERIDFFSF